MMFKAAGATTANMPSNEIYVAMQTGAIDAAATSSTSLLSFKLEELSKHLTSAKGKSFFFIFEPILMSTANLRLRCLPSSRKRSSVEVGESLESVGSRPARSQMMLRSPMSTSKAGVADRRSSTMPASMQWKKVAADSAWKDFAARSAGYRAKFLEMAQKV